MTLPEHPVVDTLVGGVVIGSLLGWLPPIAALCAIFWYGVLFYDRFKKK